jgi:transcriptional regulator with XRE-family HTH domain
MARARTTGPKRPKGTSVGARIRAARRQSGLTQDELADAVGVSRSAVAQWETDRAGQVTTNLARIAAALGTNVEYLMRGDSKQGQGASSGDELAMLRLYRNCSPDDRQILLRTAQRLARGKEGRGLRSSGRS